MPTNSSKSSSLPSTSKIDIRDLLSDVLDMSDSDLGVFCTYINNFRGNMGIPLSEGQKLNRLVGRVRDFVNTYRGFDFESRDAQSSGKSVLRKTEKDLKSRGVRGRTRGSKVVGGKVVSKGDQESVVESSSSVVGSDVVG